MTASPETAFEAFYARHRPKVMAYCRRRARGHEATEAADETFLVAWRRWDEIPGRDEDHRARAWLYGVAYRVLSNQRRGRDRRLALLDRLGSKRRRTGFGPEQSLLRTEEQREVVSALHRLAPDDREVLRLSAWEELSNADLALALDCSTSAAAQRLHRARNRLARVLSDTPASIRAERDTR